MVICRPPCPALRPFVTQVWAEEPAARVAPGSAARREHVLPTGHMHLALRLRGPGVRVWREGDGAEGSTLATAVIGGARAVLEDLLWQRLQAAQAPHPAVLRALSVIGSGGSVEQAVRQSHYSHRHLLTLFKQATGLSPKAYARIVRLQGVLKALHRDPALGWAEAADAAGYSDQSHFNREFRAFSGLTPAEWRRAAPAHPNHVPLPPAR